MTHVKQAGLRNALVSGRYPAYSKVATVEGVVIAVRHIDDAKNISKVYTEYDVRDLRTGQVYENCRRLHEAAGMDDGEDNKLRPAQKLIGATSPVFDPRSAQLSQSDGDRVALSFSYGAQHSPVIIGVLPHSKSNYVSRRDQGPRRFQTHKGTSVETKQDGTHEIKRGETTITLHADETVDITHKTGSKLRFKSNGDIEITAAGDIVMAEASQLEGVVVGTGVDPFTGSTYNALQSASRKVFAKK